MIIWNNLQERRKNGKNFLTDENLNQLAQIIEAGEKCNTQWNRSHISVVEFHGDTKTDFGTTLQLRISCLGRIALIISNVSLKNKHCGTMSKILEFLIQKCKENNVPKIIVQYVLTEEMASFCLKEFLSGDYELSLVNKN